MPLDSDDSTRCLRRNWNQHKSHLPKYSSLPEFQLIARETSPSYLCRRRASVINPISPSLGSALTCKEAQPQHEFASSVSRVRRASAPSTVFLKVDLSPWKFTFRDHANIDSNRPDAPLEQGELRATTSVIDSMPFVSSQSPSMPVDQTSFHVTAVDLRIDDIDDIDINNYAQQRVVPESLCDVATATRSSSTSPRLFGQSTIKPVEYNSEHHNSAMGLRFSRSTFNFGRTDKMPSFHPDNAHEHANYVSRSHDYDKPPSSPINSSHQHSRPLRRKNHLHIMPCAPDPNASEPIAISLTLHHSSPPASSHLGKKTSQRLRRHSHTRAHSHPQSISSDSNPATPMTPTFQRSPPSSFPPPKTSSPVRLGHPSRPYYTAIRKNISPPTSSRSRPQSVEAPMTSTAIVTNASRHLSMSAVPPASSTLDDDGDFEVRSGPTNSARLSLNSIFHRQSYDNRTQTHTRNAQSLSRAANGTISNRTIGFGCSMSGETELRMALAASPPSGVATTTTTTFGRRSKTGDEFRFRETVVPSQNMANDNDIQNSFTNTGTDYLHTRHVGSRDSFMGKVKKLRKFKGLKEMLMN